MQTMARFWITSNFDGEYLQNGKIFKIGQVHFVPWFLPHCVKKNRWTLIYKSQRF